MEKTKFIASERKPHIIKAHEFWKNHLQKGDIVIDATCGNGHDSLILAQLAVSADAGKLFLIDIQEQAINNTKERLKNHLSNEQLQRIAVFQMCHSHFPPDIAEKSVKLIVYNLGYLPGGNKALTTNCQTTLSSLKHALKLIADDGSICLTFYPGHSQGQIEEEVLLNYISSLDSNTWNISHHRWNGTFSPHLLIIKKGEG